MCFIPADGSHFAAGFQVRETRADFPKSQKTDRVLLAVLYNIDPDADKTQRI
jgi:hypothetical protein